MCRRPPATDFAISAGRQGGPGGLWHQEPESPTACAGTQHLGRLPVPAPRTGGGSSAQGDPVLRRRVDGRHLGGSRAAGGGYRLWGVHAAAECLGGRDPQILAASRPGRTPAQRAPRRLYTVDRLVLREVPCPDHVRCLRPVNYPPMLGRPHRGSASTRTGPSSSTPGPSTTSSPGSFMYVFKLPARAGLAPVPSFCELRVDSSGADFAPGTFNRPSPRRGGGHGRPVRASHRARQSARHGLAPAGRRTGRATVAVVSRMLGRQVHQPRRPRERPHT